MKKIKFFTKIKKAILNLEDYGTFAVEKSSVSIAYFFKLMIIFSLILAIVLTIKIYQNPQETLKTIFASNDNIKIENYKLIYQDLEINFNSFSVYIYMFITFTISLFIGYSLITITDVLLILLIGLIVSKLSRIRLKISEIFNISIYSITLSIILKLLYLIINEFTGFVIEYFDIMYIIVTYIYLIAAILMIKSDLIKQQIELMKIIEEQKIVHEELSNNQEEDKKKEKETDNENEKEKNEPNVEPDGNKA